jgi:hypothetical protein
MDKQYEQLIVLLFPKGFPKDIFDIIMRHALSYDSELLEIHRAKFTEVFEHLLVFCPGLALDMYPYYHMTWPTFVNSPEDFYLYRRGQAVAPYLLVDRLQTHNTWMRMVPEDVRRIRVMRLRHLKVPYEIKSSASTLYNSWILEMSVSDSVAEWLGRIAKVHRQLEDYILLGSIKNVIFFK